jgi:Putative MetA-pathway of phenol degradation
MAIPSYTFAERFLGGQTTVAVAIPTAASFADVDATLSRNLGLRGPGFLHIRRPRRQIFGFGDVVPMFNVRWNDGVNNFMACVTGNITVGRYDPTQLANLGIGHNVIDIGGAYTFSIRRPATNSPPRATSPTISRTCIRNTKTASTCISMSAHRISFQRKCFQRRLRLQAAHLQRLRRSCRLLRVAGSRRGPSRSVNHAARHDASGLAQLQGLQRIRRRAPARWMERVAHLRDLAGSADRGAEESDSRQVIQGSTILLRMA